MYLDNYEGSFLLKSVLGTKQYLDNYEGSFLLKSVPGTNQYLDNYEGSFLLKSVPGTKQYLDNYEGSFLLKWGSWQAIHLSQVMMCQLLHLSRLSKVFVYRDIVCKY